MTPTPALAWRGVTRRYRTVTALRDFDLELVPGQVHGLLGPNGSGKTTAMRTVLGLTAVDDGEVRLFGRVPSTETRRRVGYLPEACRLPDEDQVRALLVVMLRLRGFSGPDARVRGDGWLERLGLLDKAGTRVCNLSKGQQQRVQIALTLAHEPEVLILDEPFTGLDLEYQNLLGELIRDASARGATVVLCTHRLRQAEALIDHVVLMSEGRKLVDGSLSALRRRKAGEYFIEAAGDVGWLHGPEVASVDRDGEAHHVTLVDGADVSGLLARAARAAVPPTRIEQATFDLPALFVEHVGSGREHR